MKFDERYRPYRTEEREFQQSLVDEPLDRLDRPSLTTDLVCFSQHRWDFVFQRPQQLLMRFSSYRRVFFFEEPAFELTSAGRLRLSARDLGENRRVYVVTPVIPLGLTSVEVIEMETRLLDEMIDTFHLANLTFWYCTPLALRFSRQANPMRVIYDCTMDYKPLNLSAEIKDLENELLAFADHVFTSGRSVYEAKYRFHSSVHLLPSGIDVAHFAKARTSLLDPWDQAALPHPRIGFYGVIDERIDFSLLREIAEMRPRWSFIMIGPIKNVDFATLPAHENIHYLGLKERSVIPSYLAHWDVAMLPLILNESTRFINPTKTPEYLAAGKPTVSTAIRDVVRPYGELGLVQIADSSRNFISECTHAMDATRRDKAWLKRVDHFLAGMSWERIWEAMARLEKSIDCLAVRVRHLPRSILH